MCRAAGSIATAADRRPGGTARSADRLVDCENDVGNSGLAAVASQQIPAAWTAHAGDEAGLAQHRKELLEVRQRYLLPFGDLGERNWVAVGVLGEIDHCHDGISPLGAQSHDAAPQATRS